VKKREHYHKLGIPLYAIVDQQTEGGPRTMRPYRRTESGYVEIETDFQERFDIRLLHLSIGLTANRVVCYDLGTLQELGNYTGIVSELAKEKEARQKAERQRDEAREAREQAELAITEQVEARHKAEREADKHSARADEYRKKADLNLLEADKQR